MSTERVPKKHIQTKCVDLTQQTKLFFFVFFTSYSNQILPKNIYYNYYNNQYISLANSSKMVHNPTKHQFRSWRLNFSRKYTPFNTYDFGSFNVLWSEKAQTSCKRNNQVTAKHSQGVCKFSSPGRSHVTLDVGLDLAILWDLGNLPYKDSTRKILCISWENPLE